MEATRRKYIEFFDWPIDRLNPFDELFIEDKAGIKGYRRIAAERKRINRNSHGTRNWSRYLNSLKRSNIWCIGDLFQIETSDLLKIRNLGEKGVAELLSSVEKLLRQYREGDVAERHKQIPDRGARLYKAQRAKNPVPVETPEEAEVRRRKNDAFFSQMFSPTKPDNLSDAAKIIVATSRYTAAGELSDLETNVES